MERLVNGNDYVYQITHEIGPLVHFRIQKLPFSFACAPLSLIYLILCSFISWVLLYLSYISRMKMSRVE